MIKTSFRIATLFLVGGIIFACTKEKSNISSETKVESNNPYEFVGKTHNIALSNYLEGNFKGSAKDNEHLIFSDVKTILNENFKFEFEQKAFEKYIYLENKTSDFIIGDAIILGEDPLTYFENNLTYVGNKERVVLNSMKNNIFDFESNKNVALFNIKTVALENQIINRKDINSDSKELLLGAISVAKNSAFFWIIETDFLEGKKGKGKVILADVGGFIGGFLGTLVYNNNNGGSPDINPFGSGVAIATLSSALAKED